MPLKPLIATTGYIMRKQIYELAGQSTPQWNQESNVCTRWMTAQEEVSAVNQLNYRPIELQ
jgi:hypothetical protein